MAGTTNPIGARMIARYKAGTATRDQLDAAYRAGLISDEDYADTIYPIGEEPAEDETPASESPATTTPATT